MSHIGLKTSANIFLNSKLHDGEEHLGLTLTHGRDTFPETLEMFITSIIYSA